MSMDFLDELERQIENGKEFFACPGLAQKQWYVRKNLDELRKFAKRAADNRKTPVSIMRMMSKNEGIPGVLYLIPTRVEDSDPRSEPNIQWSVVETREAAETMKFPRTPFFCIQIEENVEPG